MVFAVVMAAPMGMVARNAAVALMNYRHTMAVMVLTVMAGMRRVMRRHTVAMVHRAAALAIEPRLARDSTDLPDVVLAVLSFLQHIRVAVGLLGKSAASSLVLAVVLAVLQALMPLVAHMTAVLVLFAALMLLMMALMGFMLFMVLRHCESPPVRPASGRTIR